MFKKQSPEPVGTLKHLTNTLKIVKKESIHEVASLKSLTVLNELELPHSFFLRIFPKFK